MALETASIQVLVVGLAYMESGCKAIPHLDADTRLDLGRTREGESVHHGIDRTKQSRRCCWKSKGWKELCHMLWASRGHQRVALNSAKPGPCWLPTFALPPLLIDCHTFSCIAPLSLSVDSCCNGRLLKSKSWSGRRRRRRRHR